MQGKRNYTTWTTFVSLFVCFKIVKMFLFALGLKPFRYCVTPLDMSCVGNPAPKAEV